MGCGGRSTESAAPRIVVTPRAASASTDAWSKASPGGRATVGIRPLLEDPFERLVAQRHCSSRCVRRPGDSRAGSLGAANGIACSRTRGRATIARRRVQRLGRVRGTTAHRPRRPCPIAPLVAVRRLPQLIEGGGGDDQVECGSRSRLREEVGERLDLRDDAAAGFERRLESGIDQGAVGSERDRRRDLGPPREQDRPRGSWKMWIAAVVSDGDRWSTRRSGARAAADTRPSPPVDRSPGSRTCRSGSTPPSTSPGLRGPPGGRPCRPMRRTPAPARAPSRTATREVTSDPSSPSDHRASAIVVSPSLLHPDREPEQRLLGRGPGVWLTRRITAVGSPGSWARAGEAIQTIARSEAQCEAWSAGACSCRSSIVVAGLSEPASS